MTADHKSTGTIRHITSLANPLIKDIRALALKKKREETGLFLGEGLKLVTDALDRDWPVAAICLAGTLEDGAPATKAATRVHARGGDVLTVPAAVLAKITRRDNPQMVVGVFRQKLTPADALSFAPGALFVALDRIRDPGNLGTIIRTADAAGVDGVVLLGETCDPFSMEAVRATMGSLFHVPLVRTSAEALFAQARRQGARIIATHLKAHADYRTLQLAASADPPPTLLLMGNEQQGLPDALAARADLSVKIPMRGEADSLNLAVATALMIYEARRNMW